MTTTAVTIDVQTAHGLGRAHLYAVDHPRAALVLGHGAAGAVASQDLLAVTEVAQSEGMSVVLFEQPYKVAGRRSPAPAHKLDAAWTTAVDELSAGVLQGLPLVAGGRSLGARVACRTANTVGAIAVLCLAFPLHAPGRGDDAKSSRLAELEQVTVPTLVVQGDRDPFGMPSAAGNRTVVRVSGDHSLKTDLEAVAAAVRTWLPSVLSPVKTS